MRCIAANWEKDRGYLGGDRGGGLWRLTRKHDRGRQHDPLGGMIDGVERVHRKVTQRGTTP
jgi:hypothetical protein